MAATTQTRRTRSDSPARWMKAAQRAISEGIQIRQLQGSGQWVATSGTDAALAYEVQVIGNVAIGCDCLAGLNDDPVCKHRAAYYLLIGALEPEPEPPAPAALVVCFRCREMTAGWPVCTSVGAGLRMAQATALATAADEFAAQSSWIAPTALEHAAPNRRLAYPQLTSDGIAYTP